MNEGILVHTAELPSDIYRSLPPEVQQFIEPGGIAVEHEPISFPNYPYEWSPGMLQSAGRLTIEMARSAAAGGFTLKDATPYNLMFEGPNAVFLDLLSFDRADRLDPLWRPFAQFTRTFLYPLYAWWYAGVRLDETMSIQRDGLEPNRMWRLCPGWRLALPPLLGAVTLPVLFDTRKESTTDYRPRQARDANEASFLRNRVFNRALRLIGQRAPTGSGSEAASYMESGHTYSDAQFAAKEETIREAVERRRPASVLDMGCNTGHFSLLAARTGVRVVGIDQDPEAVDTLWRAARAEKLPVLPLVENIARPHGSYGWENDEFPSFLDRARGRFECVLALALLHHLVVSERVPLDRILNLLSELTTDMAIVEYVDPADSQFQRIARGRESLHTGLTAAVFETAARQRFRIVQQREITPTRVIYVLQRSSS